MNRREFVGTALAGLTASAAFAADAKPVECAHGAAGGRRREVLAALARAVGPGRRHAGRLCRSSGPTRDNVLWKVEVPGAGNSSPIIWADRIFLTSSADEGKKRSILCLDRSDGKLLWEIDRARRQPGKDPAQERLRLRHALDRRRTRLRLLRQSRPDVRRLRRQAALAPDLRRDGRLSRHVLLAAALPGPRHRLPGPSQQVGFVRGRLRQEDRQAALEDGPQGKGRLGLAGRHPRRRPRRDHRQQRKPGLRLRSRTMARCSGTAAATWSK